MSDRMASDIRVMALVSALLLGPVCCSHEEMAPAPQMATATPHSNEYSRVDIFFVSWESTTPVALSLDDVRRQPDVTLTYSLFRANDFANWLQRQIRRLPSRTTLTEDVRLVIDFRDGRDELTTFYATRFGLHSADGTISRHVDDAFRRPFTALGFGRDSMWGNQ
jgi:hypothetical protein